MSDISFMARALELAKQGRFTTSPNPNVGCVLVKDNQIIGEGFHVKAGQGHAEVNALEMVTKNKTIEDCVGATAYVTLEPCSHYGRTPPCAEALIKAGITRVVIAMQDPNHQVAGRGIHLLQQAGVDVTCGVLAEHAEQINKGFLKRMRTGLPYVQLKLAASLDGKTAMASGESQWITSPAARSDVQVYRATSCAILSTSGTVLADDPSLTVRWSELPHDIQQVYLQQNVRQPLRVIIDVHNRLTPELKLFQQKGKILLVRGQECQQHWPEQVAIMLLPLREGQADLELLMIQLAKKQVNTLWVEAGATLAGALLQQNLVDELVLYLAPKLLGHQAQGLCKLPGLAKLADAPEFILQQVAQIGPDIRLNLQPKY